MNGIKAIENFSAISLCRSGIGVFTKRKASAVDTLQSCKCTKRNRNATYFRKDPQKTARFFASVSCAMPMTTSRPVPTFGAELLDVCLLCIGSEDTDSVTSLAGSGKVVFRTS